MQSTWRSPAHICAIERWLMKVIRTMPDSGWTPVANTFAHDWTLSRRAKGLLVELLSYPDGWDMNVKKVVELGRVARKNGGRSEGRDSTYAAMEELAERRYVAYIRRRDEQGHWSTELAVSDAPIAADRLPENPEPVDRLPDYPESVNQESVDPESGGQVVLSKKFNKKIIKNVKKEDPPLSPADPVGTLLDQLLAGTDVKDDERDLFASHIRSKAKSSLTGYLRAFKPGDLQTNLNEWRAATAGTWQAPVQRPTYTGPRHHYQPDQSGIYCAECGMPRGNRRHDPEPASVSDVA